MSEHPLVAARRRAEAFHVLYWIDHDGTQFRGTVGEPNPEGFGIDNCVYYGQTLEDAWDAVARVHDERFNRAPEPRPAMKFHYTAAAAKAAGLRLLPGME